MSSLEFEEDAVGCQEDIPLKTALYELHVSAGARMVSFAGYLMPVQYEGIKSEHLHVRSYAGLFDVSHMGQILVSGEGAAQALEKLLPVDLEALELDQLCYSFFPSEEGGVLDDLIITRRSANEFMLVVNAACKQDDIAYLTQYLSDINIDYFEQQSLLALQGPLAQSALSSIFPDAAKEIEALTFMRGLNLQLDIDREQFDCYISRSGYTGEDGFEISLPDAHAAKIAKELLKQDVVRWIGLGARDSLRLEAGLCLYGHDMDVSTSPVQAGLGWSIDKCRRKGGAKEGGFIGADSILNEIENGVSKKRVGFKVDGRVPVREGAEIIDQNDVVIGRVSSGGYASSLGGSIVMAYIDVKFLSAKAVEQAPCFALVRGKKQSLTRCKMPFVAHQYVRG